MNPLKIVPQGYVLNPLRKINSIKNAKYKHIIAEEIASMIAGKNNKDILALTKYATKKEVTFLSLIAQKINIYNLSKLKLSEEEKPEIIEKIFKTTKNPKLLHFKLLNNFQGSPTQIVRIFQNINNKRAKLKFASKINDKILSDDPNVNLNLISELLESKYISKYIKNYNKFESYLKLNRNNQEAVKTLENLLDTNSFDAEKYNKIYIEQQNIKKFPLINTPDFNDSMYATNYNPLGNQLIKDLKQKFFITKKSLESGDAKELAKIYETTTKKNYNLRAEIIDKFDENILTENTEDNTKHITKFNELFKIIDEDKNTRKFIKYFLQNNINNYSIQDIMELFRQIPAKHLNMFRKNIIKIMKQTNENNKIILIKDNMLNPFFETENVKRCREQDEQYGFITRRQHFGKVYQKLTNYIKVKIYQIQTKYTPTNIIDTNRNQNLQILEQQDKIKKEYQTPILIMKDPETNTNIPNKTKREVKKEKIKNNILEIIKNKLGKTTYNTQKREYIIKSAQMRLDLLPEIFASIKDTRKADRLAGKKRIKSSNKDALELYELIRGRNKKYISYLLKKRKDDNTRLFEIKDIIEIIKKAEAKILADKNANQNYKANDARKYYNHLYEAKIQEYGKLKRTHKVNTKA